MENQTRIDSLGPWCAVSERFEMGSALRCHILQGETPLSYGDVIDAWRKDLEFGAFYVHVLKRLGFPSYVWETPPLTLSHLDRRFEFVMIEVSRGWSAPDRSTFAEFFDRPSSVVSFANLGADARLVVPTPADELSDYRHLAAFVAQATQPQQLELWRVLGETATQQLSSHPIWISAAGGGVAWLHLRIDEAPKYYRYQPYKVPPKDA